MAATGAKLTAIVETYLTDLRNIHASGGATGELSYHTPLNNLLTAVGATLKPKIRCVGERAALALATPISDSTPQNRCRRESGARASFPSAASSRLSPPPTTHG